MDALDERIKQSDANWWTFSPDTADPNIRDNKILSSKLKGLREVNRPKGKKKRLLLDYHSYIGLDRLLTSQVPSTIVPDERAFIITHQLCELIFKLMIFDLTVVADTLQRLLGIPKDEDEEFEAGCRAGECKAAKSKIAKSKIVECKATDVSFWQPALTASARIEYSSKTLLPAVFGYLAEKETFNNDEFFKFRNYLIPSSGFQTAQFRLIQKALGKTNLLGIRLYPARVFRENYGKQGEGLVSVIDPLILGDDSQVASPETGPLTRAARIDEYAHQTLDRLHRVANAGGTEFHPPRVRRISKSEIEKAVEEFQEKRSDSTPDVEAWSTFRQDLEAAVKTENERRAGLAGARHGAFYLHSVDPKPYLAQVLDRLSCADSTLHGTDTDSESLISLHRKLAGRRTERSPGTGGGGVRYLRHVDNNLIRLFPALVAYHDLKSPRMKIEALTQPHAEATRQIYNHYVMHSTAMPERVEQSPEAFDSKLKGYLSAYVATDETGVVGYAFAKPYDKDLESFDSTVEFGVYLRPGEQRRGTGKLLIEKLVHDMKACGKHAVIAKIDANNVASIKLFKKLGFCEAARLNEIGFKFERHITVIYMQLML